MSWVGALVGAIFGGGIGNNLSSAILGGCGGYLLVAVARLSGELASLRKHTTLESQKFAQAIAQLTAQQARPGTTAEPEAEIADTAEAEAPAVDDIPPSAVDNLAHDTTPITQTDSAPPILPEEPTTQPDSFVEQARARQAAASISEPVEDIQPNILLRLVKGYFTEGNIIVRVGLLVLLVGLAMMLKFAADHGKLPIELRLLGAMAVGVVLQVIGWRTRVKHFDYAVSLLGGGAGVLFLTTFFALKTYHVIHPGLGFSLLVAVAIEVIVLSVLLNAKWLALIGVIGGFLAPILTSDGSGNFVALFSYYVILNAIVLTTAYYKYWREVSLAGFLFTFVVTGVWGVMDYDTTMFFKVEPFLAIFFLMFVSIGILYAVKHRFSIKHYVDSTLVIGTPIATFAYQWEFIGHNHYGLAAAALVMAAFYLGIWFAIKRWVPKEVALLQQTHMVLAVGFATIALPLLLSDQAVGMVWAAEGAALIWLGVRQARWISKLGGMIVTIGAIGHAGDIMAQRMGDWVFANPHFILFTVLACSLLLSAWLLSSEQKKCTLWEKFFAVPAFILAILAAYFAIGFEVSRFAPNNTELGWIIAGFALFHLLMNFVWQRSQWQWCLRFLWSSILAYWWFAALLMAQDKSLLVDQGMVGWIVAIVVSVWLLFSWRQVDGKLVGISHSAYYLSLAALVCYQSFWWLDRTMSYGTIWPHSAVVVVLLCLFVAPTLLQRKLNWPFGQYASNYGSQVTTTLFVGLSGWLLMLNIWHDGLPTPWVYWPILNPLDVITIAGLIGLLHLSVKQSDFISHKTTQISRVICSVLAFVALNSMLFRAFHYHYGIPFDWERFFDFNRLQATVAIVWTMLASVIMFWAAKSVQRRIWYVGAILLGATVVKLFTVELVQSGTMTRIVAFIAVGALLLLIGYLCPIPPSQSIDSDNRES